jgi:TP901 family phage tail tape measure protein
MDVGTLKYNLEVNDQGSAKSISEASKAVDTLKSNFEDADKKGKFFSKAMLGMNSEALSLSKTVVGLAGGIAAAGAALGGVAIKQAVDFQTNMSNVNTLLNQSQGEIAKFGDQVLELSKSVPVSGSLLSESLYGIVSAGITDTTDAMNVLEQSAKLGVAGLGSTASASDVLTSSLNAFQLDASYAAENANILFKTVKAGKTTIDDLATGFGQVAPIASAAGVTFKELQAATAALTVSGLQTSVAQTQLKAAFVELNKEGSKLDKAFEGIGISNVKAAVEADGFVNTLKKLQLEGGYTEIELQNLFGSVEAGGAAIALLGSQNEAFNKTMIDMSASTAGLTEAFDVQSQTFKSQAQILKNEFNAALISAGTQILPSLSDAVGRLSGLLSENSEAITGVLVGLAKFAAGIVGPLLEGIIKISTFLAEHKVILATVAGAIVGLMVPALKAFAINAALALAPLLPYVAAFAAVSGAVALLYTNFDKITGFLEGAFPNAFAVAEGVINTFKAGIEIMAESMKTSMEKISENSLVANNESVANLVSMSQESSKAILQMKLTGEGLSGEMKDTIVNNALEMRNQVVSAMDGFAQAQIDSLQSLTDSGILTNEILESASAKTMEFAEAEKVAAQERVDRIKEIGELLSQENASTIQNKEELNAELARLNQEQTNAVLTTTNAQVSEILGLQELLKVESGSLAAEQGAKIVQEAVAKKEAVVAAAEEEYKETVATLTLQRDQIGSITQEEFEDSIAKAQEKKKGQIEEATAASEGVIAQVEKMAEEQGLIFDRSTNQILTGWQQFWREVGQAIKNFFTETIPRVAKGAADIAVNFLKGVAALPGRASAWAREVMNNIINGIRNFLGGVANSAKEIGTNVLNAIKEVPGKMLEAGKNIVRGLVDGIKSKIQSAVDTMSAFGQRLLSGFKSLFGIASPSKVFHEFGENTAEGFLLGLDSGSPDALDAMTRFSQGLIDEAKVVEESLNFEGAFQELSKVVDGAYAEAEKAVLNFVSENLKSQEDIRKEIEKTEADINKLTASFEKASEAARVNFEGKATDIVLGAENKSSDIQAEINKQKQEGLEIQEKINLANSIGEEGAKDLKKAQEDQIKNQEKLIELQAKLAEQQAILKTAEESGVVSAAQLEEARRLASLNPLEALIEQYAAEKEARDQAFNDEQAQLEERRAALEASLQERQDEYANFMTSLLSEDQKFTEAVNIELQKREQSTTDSINRLILMYNRLAAAKRSIGKQEGGMAEGSNVQFSEGGKTGIGHDNEVAGDVHKNEYVVPAWMTRGMPNMIKHLEGVRTKQIPMGETINNNQKNVTVNQVVNNDVDAVAAFYRLKWMM